MFTTAVGCELEYPIQTIEPMKNFQNKVIYEEFGKQAPLEVLSIAWLVQNIFINNIKRLLIGMRNIIVKKHRKYPL